MKKNTMLKKNIKKQKVTKKHDPETTVNHPALVGECKKQQTRKRTKQRTNISTGK